MTKIIKLKGKNFLGVKASREEIVLPVGTMDETSFNTMVNNDSTISNKVNKANNVEESVPDTGAIRLEVEGGTNYTFNHSIGKLIITSIANSSEFSTIEFTARDQYTILDISPGIQLSSEAAEALASLEFVEGSKYFLIIKNGILLHFYLIRIA